MKSEHTFLEHQVKQNSEQILELTKYSYSVNGTVTGLIQAQKAMQENFTLMFNGFLATQKSLMEGLTELQKDLSNFKQQSNDDRQKALADRKVDKAEKSLKSKIIAEVLRWWPLWLIMFYSVFTHHNFPEILHRFTGG
jgi:hypothetical protein